MTPFSDGIQTKRFETDVPLGFADGQMADACGFGLADNIEQIDVENIAEWLANNRGDAIHAKEVDGRTICAFNDAFGRYEKLAVDERRLFRESVGSVAMAQT